MLQPMTLLRLVASCAFAAGCTAVLVLSLLPGTEAPSLGLWDKAEHFGGYAALGGLGALATWRPGRSMVPLLLFLSLLGAALEIGQALSPGRSPELGDAIANALGALMGIAFLRGAMIAAGRIGRRERQRTTTGMPPLP